MKKIALMMCAAIALVSCNSDDDQPTEAQVLGCTDPTSLNYDATATQDDGSCEFATTVDFTFSQNWDGAAIANADYENTVYINANQQEMTLSKLVYLISDVTFTSTSDATQVFNAEDYNLINARTGVNASFTPNIEIPEGEYNVSFTFGFDDEDNDKEGGYPDLNQSPADVNWGVPAPLGGGYHYQRIEGTFENDFGATTNFQFHTIRANRHQTLPPGPGTLEETTDTSFIVDLGAVTIGSSTNIEVAMNVAEWFKNPIVWDLNTRFQILMPNYQAQLDMNENGASVFSKGTVTQ